MRGPTRLRAFHQLSEFMRHDVKNVLRMEHGGNYTAALLLSVGAESLSLLQDKDPNFTLVSMLEPYGVGRRMAVGIQDALRDGLAHIFETKYVEVEGTRIELIVSWGALEHLSVRPDPLGLVLNVKTLWDDLQQQLDRVTARLEREPRWAEDVPKAWREGPVYQVRGAEAMVSWRDFFASRGARL